MERERAILWFFIFLILFIYLCYYGTWLTFWSSFILSLFISLVIMNIFYPPSRIAGDDPDNWLYLYAGIEIIGVIFLFIYIIQKALCDVRRPVQ